MLRAQVVLLLLAMTLHSETAVLFETNFGALPPAWYSDQHWTFGSPGAHLFLSVCHDVKFGEFYSAGNYSDKWYFIPDGTDSVTIDILHNISAGSYSMGDTHAWIKMNTTTQGFYHIYQCPNYETEYSSNTPIYYVYQYPPQGTYISFMFDGSACAEAGSGAMIDWDILFMQVTAYGNGFSLEMNSWASIKNSLGEN